MPGLRLFLLLICVPLFLYAADKDIFLKQLAQWQPQSAAHPRLYRDAMARLVKQKNKRVESFLTRCDSVVVKPMPDYRDYHGMRHRAMNQAQDLAFAFALTGRRLYGDRMAAIVRQMLVWPDWVYTEHKPLTVDLGVATVARCLAFCYDFAYSAFNKAERSQIEMAVVQRALHPFKRVYQNKSEKWTEVHHNWRSVICGKMGVAVLAFWQHCPDAQKILLHAVDGVADVLDHADPSGGWEEGVHYWGYGIGEAAFFIEALYRVSNGLVDMYRSPFLSNTGNFGLHMRTPAGLCFNFSDCESHAPLPWLLGLLADHYKNPHWQWSSGQEIGSDWPDLLFYDPFLFAQQPDTTMLGFCFPGASVAAIRSSWQHDALFLGLKSGSPLANHGHLDLNSFVLHAFGVPLLIDEETWPYAHSLGFFDVAEQRWNFEANHTLGHNTLLVDGQGQEFKPSTAGRILSFDMQPSKQTAVLEADSAYGRLLSRFRRYSTVLAGRAVIVVDDIRAEGLRKLEWLANYRQHAEEIHDGLLLVKNDSVHLAIDFLRPAATEARVITFSRSVTGYDATYTKAGLAHSWFSVRPLHRQKQYRFVTVLMPYRESRPFYTARILSESEEQLTLVVDLQERSFTIEYDFADCRVQVR